MTFGVVWVFDENRGGTRLCCCNSLFHGNIEQDGFFTNVWVFDELPLESGGVCDRLEEVMYSY